MGLVIWIAIHVRNLLDLHYMDNIFGYEYDPMLVYYTPYNDYLPEKQARLLSLWDEIGLPHERHKQVFGPAIKIIGFWVDPRDLSISMSTTSKAKLIASIQDFINTSTSHTCPLMEWQCILSWINWGFNVFPLLRPGLQSLYEKISGKSHAHAPVYLNRRVIRDLTWVSLLCRTSTGSASSSRSCGDLTALTSSSFVMHLREGWASIAPHLTLVSAH